MSDTLIRVELTDHVAQVVLQRPTMTPAFFDALGDTFRALADDDALRVVLVSSAAKAFSYGLDLVAVMQSYGPLFAGGGLAAQRAELHRLILRWQASVTAVAECPAPVIAAVHGWCIGGGLDLASACDLRLASADAQFSLRETRLAIVADLGSLHRLPAIIGEGRTRELAFTGDDLDATRAQQMGLVNDVFPDRDSLLAGARELAARIAANPPLVVRGVKDVMAQRERQRVDEGLRYVAAWNSAFLASEDLGEALAAFMEKRAPRFQGR